MSEMLSKRSAEGGSISDVCLPVSLDSCVAFLGELLTMKPGLLTHLDNSLTTSSRLASSKTEGWLDCWDRAGDCTAAGGQGGQTYTLPSEIC